VVSSLEPLLPGILQRKQDLLQPSPACMGKMWQRKFVVTTREQQSSQQRQLMTSLLPLAQESWEKPGHPGWALYQEDSQQTHKVSRWKQWTRWRDLHPFCTTAVSSHILRCGYNEIQVLGT
jgi:hypothetical protein